MKTLSYDLDLFLSDKTRSHIYDSQEAAAGSLLPFFHEHRLFKYWLETTGLLDLWQDHKLLVIESLTHPSLYHQVGTWPTAHNQRLEFLGDSALDFYISKKLITLYPGEPEGFLSKLRSTIVSEEGLTMWGKALGLHEVLLVGRGEIGKLAQSTSGIIADGLEALIAVMSTQLPNWEERLDEWIKLTEERESLAFFDKERLEGFDPKTTLQEKTLALYRQLPCYEATLVNNVELKQQEFKVTLKLGKRILGEAKHLSKKKAKALAATNALKNKSYLGLTTNDFVTY